jgi:hypothetical protein
MWNAGTSGEKSRQPHSPISAKGAEYSEVESRAVILSGAKDPTIQVAVMQ